MDTPPTLLHQVKQAPAPAHQPPGASGVWRRRLVRRWLRWLRPARRLVPLVVAGALLLSLMGPAAQPARAAARLQPYPLQIAATVNWNSVNWNSDYWGN
jgi:hypothetical protein